jgi:hypothetical protein
VVLVGPDRPNQFHLNSRAEMIVEKLGLKPDNWSLLERQPIR